VNFVKALQVSSNVFFYQQGLNIGPKPIAAEARRLGLDQPTGVNIFETTAMKVPDPTKKGWTDGDTANFAIGQGALQVTPLQMACLVASIARQQTRTRPTLLHDPEANAAKVNEGGETLGLTPDEYALLIDGMEHCVSAPPPEGGTAYATVHAALPNIRIAGKTGTAQRPSYGKDLTIAWFVGFAPIDHPRIAVAVAVESTEVGQNYWGGAIAGPVAAAMLKEYFTEYPEDKAP
jgi:penicillin-binding protein 2